MSAFPIDRAFIIRHLTRMVQIESINPGLVPGGAGEGALAAYIAETLRAIGVETIVETVEPGRDTVIGRLRGGGNGPSLMLNAHTDTVGVGGMAEPFSGAVREGRLYGRGSFDMKGSIAACLAMLDGMVRADVRRAGDLLFTAVVDEEYGSKGMEALVRSYRTDAAIVTEPTGLRVCCAQRGFVWIAIETIGRAAHGSRYMDGIDANAMMGRVLVALDAYGRELLQRTGHPLLGPPSVHVPLIQGGTSQSVYAAHCRLEIERRTVPGDSPTSVLAEVQAIIDRLAAEDTQFRATVTRLFDRPPYEIDPAAGIAQAVRAAAYNVTGREPEVYGELWWMDSALLGNAGIDTVIIGPAGAGAHADEEWVDLDSVEALAHILAQTALDYAD